MTMSKVRYSATFTLPDGSEFVLTRGSRQDYGYVAAWIVLDAKSAVVGKGFSRAWERAQYEADRYTQADRTRTAMVAAVTKGGAS
jgi:hypothetical protein